MKKILEKSIKDSIKAKRSLSGLKKEITRSISEISSKLLLGGRIFICGNGGSAADAQHLAAEFLVRLRPNVNRQPLPALSLAMDTSTLTACGNDYSFNKIFSRNLEALANEKDILIAISTSGNSKNIIEVLKTARKKKITSICLLGSGGGKAKKLSDINLIVDCNITARIQECHIFLGHFIFENVENFIIKNKKSYKQTTV